jgi:hypothetical protein
VAALQPTQEEILVHVWIKYPVLKRGQRQEIDAIVLQGSLPVSNVRVDLTVTLPGKEPIKIVMPLTGEDGQSFYQLEPLEATTGDPVSVQVCAYVHADQVTCTDKNFLIWK